MKIKTSIRRWIGAMIALLLMLSGCSNADESMGRVLDFRKRLLQAQGCSFVAHIEADYGESVYSFSMSCRTDGDGKLHFEVLKPQTISGIEGTFHTGGGGLIFQETVLTFPPLAEGELAPISAPWILMNTLRSGYIDTVGEEDDLLRATIHESYAEDALRLDIWFDAEAKPVLGEILWQGRSILTIHVESFEFL